MGHLDVSIIIINWNTRETLRGCLRSVYEQTWGINFEVIVVDNASSDGSAEMVRDAFQKVFLIENKMNHGFAAANNQGMCVARGRYVLLLNSDTIVLDGAIQKSIAFADQQTEMAVVGCKVLNPDKTLQPTCFMFPSLLNLFLSATYLYKLFPRSRFFGREQMTWWDRQDVREVEVVTGCFMLVRKEAIDQVGMMDKQFFMYGEETDWCYRFRQANWKIVYAPVADIIHMGGQSGQQVRVEMAVQMRASILYFMKKHYNWLSYQIACLLIIAFLVFRLPFWVGIALFSPKKRRQSVTMVKAYVASIGKIVSCLCSL